MRLDSSTNKSSEENIARPTILVAGATGYLGGRILRALANEAYASLVILKRSHSKLDTISDVLDDVKVYELGQVDPVVAFQENPIDIVINCVTNYGRGEFGRAQAIAANLTFPLELLDAAERCGSSLFIQADTSLGPNVSDYALAKHQFGQWLEQASNRLARVRLQLEHFYGPGDSDQKFIAHVIKSLVHDVPELPLTPGGQARDFVFVDDVVQAFQAIVRARHAFTPGVHSLPVGSGRSIRIKDLVNRIRDLSGNTTTKLNFGAVPYRQNEVMASEADLTCISQFGWKPRVSLPDGLQLAINYERQQLTRTA